MKSLDIRGVSRRRWRVLAVGLLITAALAVAAYVVVGPTREIKASALLVPPATSVVSYPDRESPGNPFLRLDGMDPALSVLTTVMSSEQMRDRLLTDAPQTTYTIDPDPLSQAPIVVVTATGEDPTEASRVLERVSRQIPSTLNQLQADAGVRSSARITVMPLVHDEEVTEVWSRLLRLEILLIGLGMVATILLAGLWDAVARSRAARHGSRVAEAVTSSADEEETTGTRSPHEGRGGWTSRPR